MIAEIISIGTELLMGMIANTDAQYISQKLAELGASMYFQTTVGDNPGRLRQVIEQAYSRADVIITTGGLGPTQDDLTKETVAEFFGLPMVEDAKSRAKIESFFTSMNRVMTENNLKQAFFPKGSIILPNMNGTAPGCIVEKDGKCVIILPGPPSELKSMFENSVWPYLMKKVDAALYSFPIKIFGMGESMVEDRLIELINAQDNPTLATYASMGDVTVRVTAKAKDEDAARELARPVALKVADMLGPDVYSITGGRLHEKVAELLISGKVTIAVAESCTGGMVCDMLTEVPGISASLLEGAIVYSNAAKIRMLGVSPDTLDKFGAVSAETAKEMAKGVMKASGAMMGLAITGIAGPGGGTQDKPVGLVYAALATKGGCEVRKLDLGGNRGRIRQLAALNALNMVRLELISNNNKEL
ncbi:MAG: competence/damage-inducible protein A [Christensenellales bacterium]|jgi:nicotinamide-nucleotide amidase